MRQQFPELSHGLYLRPDVHIHVEDGRSFVRRSTEKYQVLQATLVDTWASTAAGAFALSENNLYTTDAFRDYLQHLTDDGMLAFTRWGFDPPRESLRLISLAIEALRQLGETDPGGTSSWAARRTRAGLGRAGYGADLAQAASARPISSARAGAVRGGRHAGRLSARAAPITISFTICCTAPNPAEYERNYTFDITPVSDNRPFFFYTVQPRDLWAFRDERLAGESPITRSTRPCRCCSA